MIFGQPSLIVFSKIDVKNNMDIFEPISRLRPSPHLEMYRFLVAHRLEWTSNQAHADSVDKRVLKILLLLNSCGLFRKSFDTNDWKTLLRTSFDPTLFARKREQLQTFVSPLRARTLQLCFQPDLSAFLEETLCLATASERIELEKCLQDILLLRLLDKLDSDSSTACLMSTWIASLRFLEKVSFISKKQYGPTRASQ